MSIVINIDVMLARRKMSSGELAEKVGITPANLSIPRWKPSAAPSTASRATFWSTGRKRFRPDKRSEQEEDPAERLRGLSFCLKICNFVHSNK